MLDIADEGTDDTINIWDVTRDTVTANHVVDESEWSRKNKGECLV
jgi:hypothetical protein